MDGKAQAFPMVLPAVYCVGALLEHHLLYLQTAIWQSAPALEVCCQFSQSIHQVKILETS